MAAQSCSADTLEWMARLELLDTLVVMVAGHATTLLPSANHRSQCCPARSSIHKPRHEQIQRAPSDVGVHMPACYLSAVGMGLMSAAAPNWLCGLPTLQQRFLVCALNATCEANRP